MRIAILGFGTIGSGVYEIARANGIEVKYVVDLRDTGLDCQTYSIDEALLDPQVDVLVETMGGEHPAYDYVQAALQAGKSVVTSNKNLVAAFGEKLTALAKEKGLHFLYEAAVGGGIPIIRVLQNCLACDEITEIRGILNGTTNYILTRMTDDGSEFDEALQSAQTLGYAEADPTADVEGIDACRKITILGWVAGGTMTDYRNVPTTGISHITGEDIRKAKAEGNVIRLIASWKKTAEGEVLRVAPEILGPKDPLYGIQGVMNAVLVESKYLGTSLYAGAGAGKLPTATAVVADLLNIAEQKSLSL